MAARRNDGGPARYNARLLPDVPLALGLPWLHAQNLASEPGKGALAAGEDDDLLGGGLALCERFDSSGLHINFPTEDEWTWLGAQGLACREKGAWNHLTMGPVAPEGSGEPEEVAAALKTLRPGGRLSAEEERARIAAGWE